MDAKESLLAQIKESHKTVGVVFFLIIVMLLVVEFIVTETTGRSMSVLSRDPSATFKASPFVGVISNIGIIVWSASVAICLFCATILRKQKRNNHSIFFLFSGLLTFILLVDDLFMFHEYVFPRVLHIPERIIYIIYLLLILVYLLRFIRYILNTEFLLLGLALTMFGLSIVMDQVLPSRGIEFLFEDGLKLLGITTWYIYFERTGFRLLTAEEMTRRES